MDNARKAIINAIGSILGDIDESVSDETSITKDLGMDSLDKIEFVMYIEQHYSMIIPDEEIETLDTVGEWVTYLSNK